MLLANVKGNKVYFWKLVTFLGRGWSILPPTYPIDLLEGVSRGRVNCSKIFKEGGSAQISSLRGRVWPPRTLYSTSMGRVWKNSSHLWETLLFQVSIIDFLPSILLAKFGSTFIARAMFVNGAKQTICKFSVFLLRLTNAKAADSSFTIQK